MEDGMPDEELLKQKSRSDDPEEMTAQPHDSVSSEVSISEDMSLRGKAPAAGAAVDIEVQQADKLENISLLVGPNSSQQPADDTAPAEVEAARVMRKVDWHLLPLFFLLALFCSLDRANLSFAAKMLEADLGFSAATYGLGSGIFFIGYALFQVPATSVCTAVGAPTFLTAILVLWGAMACLFATLRSAAQFYVMRFVLGLAESGAYPAMWYHLATFYSERELGAAYTCVAAATSVSGLIGGGIAAGLLSLDGVGGLHGWQWLFLLEGLPTVILAIVMKLRMATSPSTAMFLEPAERDWLVQRQKDAAAASVALAESRGALRRFGWLREWRTWYLGVAWMMVDLAMNSITFWGPLIIDAILHGRIDLDETSDVQVEATAEGADAERQADSVRAALLSTIPFGSAVLAMLAVAYHAKRTGERHWHAATPVFIAAVFLGALPQMAETGIVPAFVALTLAACGVWGVHGPLLSWPALFLCGKDAASGFAFIKMLGSCGAFVGPFVTGIIRHHTHSYEPAMVLIAALLLLSAIMLLWFPDNSGKSSPLRSVRRILSKRSRSGPDVESTLPVVVVAMHPIQELVPLHRERLTAGQQKQEKADGS